MATNHDIVSHKCLRIFLENFRTGKWQNKLISNDLTLRRTNKNWPSEDGNIFDNTNNKSLALEFKPNIESKRGIQTGVGQCITYLNRFSSSYLLCPREVEGFQISDYMKNTFKEKVYGKLPVGLIEHYEVAENEVEINLLVDICESLETKTISEKVKESRYWARYKDSNPHMIFLILDCAKDCTIIGPERRKIIYKNFFDKHLFPQRFRSLTDHESHISHFGKKMMKPYSKKKSQLRKLVDSGRISLAEAMDELNQHCKWDGRPRLTQSSTDNLYLSYWKNYFKLVDHMDFWDSNYNLNEDGKIYISIGKKFGPNSSELLRYFGHRLLTFGNHYDLLLDLSASVKGMDFDSTNEAMIYSQSYMESKGYYKRNPGRAATQGSTKTFSYEFQVWEHLGLFKSSERFISGKGYNFDWEKINYYYTMKV